MVSAFVGIRLSNICFLLRYFVQIVAMIGFAHSFCVSRRIPATRSEQFRAYYTGRDSHAIFSIQYVIEWFLNLLAESVHLR